MSVPERAWKLDDLSPRSYQHPADRAATAALQKVPYLDEVVKKLIALGYERALRAASLGASVRLGQEQLPHIWVLHREVFNVLDIDDVPDLYMTQIPIANAMTFGTTNPSWCSTRSWCGSCPPMATASCWPTRPPTCTPATCSTRPR